jgi:hypothetical protein
MTRTTLAAVGAIASVTALATAQRAPEPFPGGGIQVEPLRVAPAVFGPDGPRMAGDWMPYGGAGSARSAELIYDCIRLTGTCDDKAYRFFGTGYCNMFWSNDMTLAEGTILEDGAPRMDFAWFWTANGSGTSERCIIAVFTQSSVPCEPDSFDYPGWLLDFGRLDSGVGAGYYYSEVDLSPDVWPLPPSGTGSHFMYYLQEVTTSGSWVLATCAQPVYWGTGEDRGDPEAPGTQGPPEFDDDAVIDGSHSSSECYSYAYSHSCPIEFGPAVGIWGTRCCVPGCLWRIPNCDGNGEVNTLDFLCFLRKWSAAFQSGGYDLDADCDEDGSITTQDFLCFLNRFVACFNG